MDEKRHIQQSKEKIEIISTWNEESKNFQNDVIANMKLLKIIPFEMYVLIQHNGD